MIEVKAKDAMELKNNVLTIDDNIILSFKVNEEINKKLKAYFEVLTPSLEMFTKGGGLKLNN